MIPVSIIIPTYNEERCIGRIIDYLLRTSAAEILVIDGGSVDETLSIVSQFADSTRLRLLHNPKKLQAEALNIGLSKASYSFCLRLDAHLTFGCDSARFSHHLKIISSILNSNTYCHIGFKQRFLFETPFQAALFALSHSPLLSGFSRYRYAPYSMPTHSTAWLFALRKDADLVRHPPFLLEDVPNEDMSYNTYAISSTKRPILIYQPLPLFYLPRRNSKALIRQYFRYGLTRTRRLILSGSTLSALLLNLLSFASFFSIPAGAYALASYPYVIFFYFFYITFSVILFQSIDSFSAFHSSQLTPYPLKLFQLLVGIIISPLVFLIPILSFAFGSLNCFALYAKKRRLPGVSVFIDDLS